jgi:hypothetical protein
MSFAPANVSASVLQDQLTRSMPAAQHVALGDLLVALIASHNALLAQFAAFLAQVDTADVANLGTANTATFGQTAAAPTLGSL